MGQVITSIQVDATVKHIWSLVKQAAVLEARATSEQLVHNVYAQIEQEDHALLRSLAHACHAAGYTVSMNTGKDDALFALHYYQQMAELAELLADNTLLTIALTYQGDALRRRGNLSEALQYLQAACTTSQLSDAAARGNCIQLAGRLYFQMGDISHFEQMMGEAEEIASTLPPTENSTHGQYSSGTVYIDYARNYASLGQIQKAMDYLQRAETIMPPTPHWKTLLIATRGILLVRAGDMHEGMPFVLEAVQLGNEHGNKRLLEHFYTLQRFLERKAIEVSKAKVLLDEALYSPHDF